YADTAGINVIIENHGGHSSYAPWLMGVMRMADHHRVGTLPDFGNFRIQRSEEGDKAVSYDSYRGTAELMPLAKGVSVKPTVWDDKGNSMDLDYEKMMRIVLEAGYRGYCGIEHGEEGRIWESIGEVRNKLLATRNWLSREYS
ncbi:MAG: sugar phosphate isomerase/epimerase, partial [Bacteroidota bacterium]